MPKLTVFEFNDDKDENMKYIDDNLPKPPFRWVLQGSTMCGKTNVIFNIIFKWYIDYFDRFYVFCGSTEDVDRYKLLAKKYKIAKKFWITQDVDMEELEKLYDELEKANEKKMIRSLLVFDDQAFNNINSLSKKKNTIDKIMMAGRHINMSFLMSTQQYTALNKNVRAINISAFTLFGCNDDELEMIGKEHSNHLTKDEFVNMAKKWTDKKYSFITIDRNKDIGEKFRDMEFKPIEKNTITTYIEDDDE